MKKWCVDEKIPAVLRGSLPLLEREGHVAAVAGLGPDVNFLPEAGADAWRITITAL